MYNIAIMLYYAMVCRVKIRKRGRKHMSNKKKILSLAIAVSMITSAFTSFAAPVNSKDSLFDVFDNRITMFDAENVGDSTVATTAPTATAEATEATEATTAPTATAEATEATTAPTATAEAAEATTAPTATAEAAEATPNPDGSVVYVDEDFDSYDVGTIIKSAGKDVDVAYDPVTKGKITYAAGRRTNGPMNSSVSIAENGSNKYMYVDSDGYATSGRGISFTFTSDAGIPAVSALGENDVLELSMETEATTEFELTGFGTIPAVAAASGSTTKPVAKATVLPKVSAEKAVVIKVIYNADNTVKSVKTDTVTNVEANKAIEVTADAGTKVMLWDSLNGMKPIADVAVSEAEPQPEPVSKSGMNIVRAVIDKANNKQYVIVEDPNGKVISSTIAELTATGFTGATFYTANANVKIDNLKVTKKSADTGIVNVTVKDKDGNAVADTTLTIGNATYTTDANGTATIALPNGEYSVTASKAGYEHTAGQEDNDTQKVTVNSNTQNVEMLLSLMSYVKIPDTVEIEGGQDFVAAPKTTTPSTTAAFTAKVIDQFGIEMTSDEYGLDWTIYPHGKTEADANVTIDQNGVVSVAQGFTPSDKNAQVAAYDVTVTASTEDRPNKVTKTLYIGKSDIISYIPTNYVDKQYRADTVTLSNKIDFTSDIVAVTLNMDMAVGSEDNSNTNIALRTSAGKNIAGLQLQKDGTLKAWSKWSGNSAMNGSSDKDAFATETGKVYSDTFKGTYTAGTKCDITFTIDKTNQKVTVSYNNESLVLDLAETCDNIGSVYYGNYRLNGGNGSANVLRLYSVTAQEPDPNYLAITGATKVAKIADKTIERNYALSQSVIVPDEEFTWTVTNEDGVAATGVTIDQTGKLSIADTAVAGKYKITATSTTNQDKTNTSTVEIHDFQTIEQNKVEVSGPISYNYGADTTGTYSILRAVDSCEDEVAALLPAAKWTSSNADVATITEDGKLTVVGKGTTTLTATITNSTAVSKITVPVTVGTYYVSATATGNETTVDTSSLITSDKITGYQVTTAKDGVLVKQTVAKTAPTTVDTTGADSVEIAPVFEYDVKSPGTLGNLGAGYDIPIPKGTYNFNVQVGGSRCDVYANKQMLANNVLQGGSTPDNLDVHDIVINDGIAKITTADYAKDKIETDSTVKIKVVKAPSNVTREKKMYVLGDSLVCIYYNGGSDTNNTAQTGWGQVLQNYVKNYEIVNLANSGVTANGLYGTAFTQVLESAKSGDIMVLESGYNDRTYDTKEIMTNAVTQMYTKAKDKGVDVILVSPNASDHDYSANVAFTSVMAQCATDLEAKYIDLAKLSYDFLYDTYGTNSDAVKATYNVSDRLHSQYRAAQKWASIVAGKLIDFGYGDSINTEYKYEFTDSLGNKITCQAAATPESTTDSTTAE